MDFADRIKIELPYLRRYGRALTGSQTKGDDLAVATLERILQDRSAFDDDPLVKVGLYRCFRDIWIKAIDKTPTDPDQLAARVQIHLSRLSKNTREALLLSSLEDFSDAEVSHIMDIPTSEVTTLIATAHLEMANVTTGKVLIIEDESLIAMDLESIVTQIGHQVTGLARTRDEAVKLGRQTPPDLILSDIQLADNSSGIDAVGDLLSALGDVPVIFITAFPERLLTGQRPEPTFLITKPYREDQIETAVSQALFFSSTQVLRLAT